jgi:hypothetical protein
MRVVVSILNSRNYLQSGLMKSFQVRRVAENMLNKPTMCSPPAWGLGEGLTTESKCPSCYEMLHRTSELAGSCEHGNELPGSIKGEEFLDYLSDC